VEDNTVRHEVRTCVSTLVSLYPKPSLLFLQVCLSFLQGVFPSPQFTFLQVCCKCAFIYLFYTSLISLMQVGFPFTKCVYFYYTYEFDFVHASIFNLCFEFIPASVFNFIQVCFSFCKFEFVYFPTIYFPARVFSFSQFFFLFKNNSCEHITQWHRGLK